MKRKIFISLDLPEKSKKRLVTATKPWQDLPIKWTKEQNLHITLIFLGHISDDAIGTVCEKVRSVVSNREIFDLQFTEIALVPSEREPRMVWLSGLTSPELKDLEEQLEKKLGIFVSSKKSFRPHVTLGRIRKHKWEAMENRPEIFAKFPLTVGVGSVEVIASDFSGDGPEYTVIESCPLN